MGDSAFVFEQFVMELPFPVFHAFDLLAAIVGSRLRFFQVGSFLAARRPFVGHRIHQATMQFDFRLLHRLVRQPSLLLPIGRSIVLEPIGRPTRFAGKPVQGVLHAFFEPSQRTTKRLDCFDRTNLCGFRHKYSC